jgi:DnaJ-class molecular chaperone
MNEEEIEIKEPLQEGEEICEECNGKGFLKVFVGINEKRELPCSECGGKGKIWWTEKATGIDQVQVTTGFEDSSSYITVYNRAGGYIKTYASPTLFAQLRKSNTEEFLCHASQRLLKTIKSIWLAINTQLLNPLIRDVVRILKCFKMGLT